MKYSKKDWLDDIELEETECDDDDADYFCD